MREHLHCTGHGPSVLWHVKLALSLRGAAACLEFECPWQPWDPHLRKFRDLALAIRPDSRLQLSNARSWSQGISVYLSLTCSRSELPNLRPFPALRHFSRGSLSRVHPSATTGSDLDKTREEKRRNRVISRASPFLLLC